MSRRQWAGLAGLLFGIAMIVGVAVSGTTPDSGKADAIERYQEYWADTDNQNRAAIGSIILTYACVLLVCFAASLRQLLRRLDDGPLPTLVLAAGTASAALLGAGSAMVNGAGVAAVETVYEPDGGSAMLVESMGYYTLTTGIMLAATMAVATSLSNRRTRVLPQWTAILSGLLALATIGSIFTAWVGFMVFPAWAIITGICLLAIRERAAAADDTLPAA